MIWQTSIYVYLMGLAGVVSLGVAHLSFRRRPSPGSISLGIANVAAAVWAWTSTLQLVSGTLGFAVLFHKMQYLGMEPLGVAWLVFAVEYAGRGRWASPKNIVAVSLVPAVSTLLAWTNELHGLTWKALTLDTSRPFAVLREVPNFWWWIDSVYTYFLIVAGIATLAVMFVREPGLYRRQVGALFVGAVVPVVVDASYTYGLERATPVNLTPIFFMWVGAVLYWGFSRYRLLDVTPAARDIVIERMSDCLIVTDNDDRVVYLNPAAERVIGQEFGPAVGRRIEDVLVESPDLLAAHAATKVAGGGGSGDYEHAGRFFSARTDALRDGRNRLRGKLLVLRDVTERREAELALEGARQELERRVESRTAELKVANDELSRSRRRLAYLLSSSPTVIYSCEPGGDFLVTFVGENLESQLGHRVEQVVGNADFWRQNVHPEDAHILQDRPEMLEKGQASHEYRLLSPDGTYRWIHDQVRLVRDEEGRPVELVGSWLDVTDRKRMEEKIRHSSKMEAIGLLAGGIAHDFNNLLTAIGGYAELLQMTLGEHDPSVHDVLEIRRAVDRAVGLTRQLLAFSRKQILKPRMLDLNSVVREAEEMLRRLIGHHIEFVTDLDPDLGLVRADPGQMAQVCINLIINAREAMPEGGRLLVQTANVNVDEKTTGIYEDVGAGSYVLLSVSDNGQGIEESNMPHIFEPFFTTKGESGTGLGLATVYGIVSQSGGRIAVESSAGKGSTFRVLLPRLESEIEEDISVGDPQVDRIGGCETLLVVEDEAAVRELTVRSLRRDGFQVLEADGAEAALQVFERQGPPDLMITDVVMPLMSGPELVQNLREAYPALRVLYMSGFPHDKLDEASRLSDTPFLKKPFTRDGLLEAVREALH